MMNLGKLTFALSLVVSLNACSSSICARKEKWLKNTCVGGDVTWSPDATCEANLSKCDEGHLRQAEGYVACLEAQNVCSLETMGVCQQQWPGGVNLICTGTGS